MASVRNKYSTKLHQARTHFATSRTKTPAQKIILIIIVLATLAVFIALLYSFIFNAERITKSKISHLATDYYENYFYPNLSPNDKNMSDVLKRYTDIGLAKVSLRQLILSNQNLSQQDIDYLQKYCDENNTFAQFFPTEPFNSTDYHTEFTYSCSF